MGSPPRSKTSLALGSVFSTSRDFSPIKQALSPIREPKFLNGNTLNERIMLLTKTIGFEIKISTPVVGYFLLSCWLEAPKQWRVLPLLGHC